MLLYIGIILFCFAMFHSLMYLNQQKDLIISNKFHSMRESTQLKQEYEEMLQTLEEAIVVVVDNTINFSNSLFQKMILKIGQSECTDSLSLEMFTVYRNGFDNE